MTLDRVSNMLSMLKNASMAGKDYIETPYTKQCESILKVLEKRKFIGSIKVYKPSGKSYKMIHAEIFKDESGLSKISEVKIMSKPGNRVYKGYLDFNVKGRGEKVLVVSTSRGIVDSVEAKKKKLGGELICEIK